MGLNKIKKLMEKLRSEEGCPWDKAQDFDTLKTFLLEETYEVIEAIQERDMEKLKEELGDLLFQVIFQAQIAEERGFFNLKEVLDALYEKMVLRHPHVFGDKKLRTSEEVLERWELRKHLKSKDGEIKVPKALPALLKSYRITDRAKQLGFDWEKVEDVEEKLKEEIGEFLSAYKKDKGKTEEEIGDILFTIANISRHLKIDPEEALQKTNKKFIKRLNLILKKIKEMGKNPKELKIEEWDRFWEEAKNKIKT